MSEHTSQTKDPSSNWIEVGSKVGALSLFLVYGIGYLVTSINLAINGMVLANPLKPRIAAAGVLFVFLIGLPVYACTETFKRVESPVPDWPTPSYFPNLYSFVRFFYVSCLLAFPLALVFAFNRPPSIWITWTLVGVFIVEPAVVTTLRSHPGLESAVRKHHKLTTFIYFALLVFIVVLGVTEYKKGGFTWLLVPYWMFFCGVWYKAAKTPASNSLSGTFASLSVQCLFPIVIFATFVYPHVKSEWGGGQPVDIVVRFTKDSPIFSAQKLKFRLIDETDAGLYVLQERKTRALFIPRSDFAALSFSSDLNDAP